MISFTLILYHILQRPVCSSDKQAPSREGDTQVNLLHISCYGLQDNGLEKSESKFDILVCLMDAFFNIEDEGDAVRICFDFKGMASHSICFKTSILSQISSKT